MECWESSLEAIGCVGVSQKKRLSGRKTALTQAKGWREIRGQGKWTACSFAGVESIKGEAGGW